MRLVDQIAQCHTPYIVQHAGTGQLTRLSGAADYASRIANCPIRFVLSDELTRLCTALAYSKGARRLACADLLRIPAQSVWVEWRDSAGLEELQRCGFKVDPNEVKGVGHRGVFIQAASDGRSGVFRTFWSMTNRPGNAHVLASNMEAYFDLDTDDNAEPVCLDGCESTEAQRSSTRCVNDGSGREPDVVRRCFRFRYERSWAEYYRRARLTPHAEAVLTREALGTITADIPMLLAFFLLLSTREGLPQRPQRLERLNRSRARSGKAPLLDHVEVLAPLLPAPGHAVAADPCGDRRPRRLHHVRGHLVRRGSELFWRVPHLRGNVRAGIVRSRTVTWTIDRPAG
jgi:hypothetical protein